MKRFTRNLVNLFIIVWISYFLLVIISDMKEKIMSPKPKLTTIEDSTFYREYKIYIQDEHEVWCIYKKDTVKLYFENAYRLSDERLLYIKK